MANEERAQSDVGFLGLSRVLLEPFTYRAMRALRAARDEAAASGQTTVEPMHILAGLMALPYSAGEIALNNLGVTRKAGETGTAGERSEQAGGLVHELRVSEATERVLRASIDEARLMGHAHIGTEHLVLGLLRAARDVNEQLSARAVSLDAARAEVLRVLESWSPGMGGKRS